MTTARGGYAFRTSAQLGLEGPQAQLLWEHGCRGVAEEDGVLVGYFDEKKSLPLDGEWQELPDVDYLERYYQELAPVELGALIVAPTHRQVEVKAGQKVLWIDPGMAFGTGHHETTRMALAALTEIDLAGKAVLDVGAGSGILAIAADLLGAHQVEGLDIDPDTIPVARENALLNRSRATFRRDELSHGRIVDVVVANLYAELHAQLAPLYAQVLRPGGTLLVTGILKERANLVEEALAQEFRDHQWRSEGEWRLLEAVRREPVG